MGLFFVIKWWKKEMQEEIFEDYEGQESSVSFFQKQRGRWTKTQRRIIDILADPTNNILTNIQIAKICKISERYLYKLMRDEKFMEAVEKKRKSDTVVRKMVNRLWRALFEDIGKYPQKIKLGLEILGEYVPKHAFSNVVNIYEKMAPEEVDERLEKIFEDRRRMVESGTGNYRNDGDMGIG